jgi:hypothetical protein
MLSRNLKCAAPLLLVLFLTGCAKEIADDRLTWLWAVAPLALFGLAGGGFVAWRRTLQLARWDLRLQPLPPDGSGTVIGLSAFASALTVAFAVLDLTAAGAATSQKVINLVLWCTFSAIAVALAAFLGRRWAERGYFRGDR